MPPTLQNKLKLWTTPCSFTEEKYDYRGLKIGACFFFHRMRRQEELQSGCCCPRKSSWIQVPSHALLHLDHCFMVTGCLLHLQASSSCSRQEKGERCKGKRHRPGESFFFFLKLKKFLTTAHGMWDCSSPKRDQTHTRAAETQRLNH